LISGAIVFVTGATILVLFHDAMMKDPSNIHELSLSAHLFIGTLLGVTVGGIGAIHW